MARIKGITVTLIDKVKTGTDPFGASTYDDVEVPIDNVLVSPTSSEDVTNQLSLTGRRAVYDLAIPKGDKHVWEERKVKFFGQTWRVIGIPLEGIESMIPLSWNKKLQVERYE
jgi:hypothetical protein